MHKSIGHNIHTFDTIESTNNYAMQQMRQNGMTHGEVVWAKAQTKGKGQRGNVWEGGQAENLLFSIVLKPSFIGLSSQHMLNELMSVALHLYLSAKGVNGVQIKFPNDVLVNGQKIAGILTECSTMGSTLEYAIVGIGLNVNQEVFSSFLRPATSLQLQTGKEFQLKEELLQVLNYINEVYASCQKEYPDVKAYYEAYLLKKDSKGLNY